MTPQHGRLSDHVEWIEDGIVRSRTGRHEGMWCRFCRGWVPVYGWTKEMVRHLNGRCRESS